MAQLVARKIPDLLGSYLKVEGSSPSAVIFFAPVNHVNC